jgi:hypothetical protein
MSIGFGGLALLLNYYCISIQKTIQDRGQVAFHSLSLPAEELLPLSPEVHFRVHSALGPRIFL